VLSRDVIILGGGGGDPADFRIPPVPASILGKAATFFQIVS